MYLFVKVCQNLKFKVAILHPVQPPGSFWGKVPKNLPLMGVKHWLTHRGQPVIKGQTYKLYTILPFTSSELKQSFVGNK